MEIPKDPASTAHDPAAPPPHPLSHTSHLARRTRHALLLEITSSFCRSLLSSQSPEELLSKYFIATAPKITEHGPEWSR